MVQLGQDTGHVTSEPLHPPGAWIHYLLLHNELPQNLVA